MIFDLDGTLVDTAPDLTHALNHVLAARALPPLPVEAVRDHVGFGARKIIEFGLTTHQVTWDKALIDRLLEEYIDYYRAHIAHESRPFPGALDAVTQLSELGLKMGVCTNKRVGLSLALLEELDMRHLFPVVLGADSVAESKPHPGHLLETIRRLGADPRRSVMVGDSPTDIATAKAAGVPVIAVSFGYAGQPVGTLQADRVIDHYDELKPAVEALLA